MLDNPRHAGKRGGGNGKARGALAQAGLNLYAPVPLSAIVFDYIRVVF
jgi:hypothetical protein